MRINRNNAYPKPNFTQLHADVIVSSVCFKSTNERHVVYMYVTFYFILLCSRFFLFAFLYFAVRKQHLLVIDCVCFMLCTGAVCFWLCAMRCYISEPHVFFTDNLCFVKLQHQQKNTNKKQDTFVSIGREKWLKLGK